MPYSTDGYPESYDEAFPTMLRNFMGRHPITRKRVTQKELGDYVGLRPQTISLYQTGERSPSSDTLLKMAEFFGVSVDYLLTGKKPENKDIRETIGLSDSTIERLQWVKEDFDDCPHLMQMLDNLLSDKKFYETLIDADRLYEKKLDIGYGERETLDKELQELYEWKMLRLWEDYFIEFSKREHLSDYYRRLDTPEERAREEAEMEKGMAAYKAAHPEPESADDLIAEMAADNEADNGEG